MLSPCQPWAVDPEANRQTARLLVRKSEGREEQGCHEEQTGELILLEINMIIMWLSKQYQMHQEIDWWKGCFTKTHFLEFDILHCWFFVPGPIQTDVRKQVLSDVYHPFELDAPLLYCSTNGNSSVGFWTTSSGLWTTSHGFWTTCSGFWTTSSGLWTSPNPTGLWIPINPLSSTQPVPGI